MQKQNDRVAHQDNAHGVLHERGLDLRLKPHVHHLVLEHKFDPRYDGNTKDDKLTRRVGQHLWPSWWRASYASRAARWTHNRCTKARPIRTKNPHRL